MAADEFSLRAADGPLSRAPVPLNGCDNVSLWSVDFCASVACMSSFLVQINHEEGHITHT